ncbi:4'-phosphopantetheinyl transferase superfamily protein [Luteolibacter ambystomatis]|uniref:4'-phosphopantetheinyl transferase superfamily protein n=1 Tax=Luteolibacter ambystomatis TaxID=2824561 RepID=A0A975G6E5_9BACT|nr:4'-phosphopantetheinyl transferase superfamily protein [Luteolibacter ambystomatis]QUE49616.1 4'-phosphopantetheinyl transferase superfamily protein [Luteolibacter ambystomatis]
MPAPLPGTLQIHIIRPGDVPQDLVEHCLTDADQKRAASFRFPEHASRWSRYRAALRMILAECTGDTPRQLPIFEGKHGKPQLRDHALHFNLSHDDTLALAVLSVDGPVGIDLESRHRAKDLPACAETFCHPEELASGPDDAALLRIWTAKEACVKASGTGFTVSPCEIRVVEDGVLDASGVTWPLLRLEHPALAGHLAHVCALQMPAFMEILDEPVAHRFTAATS